MKVCQFNKIFYKKNINIDFYLFCLKKDWKLIRFLFINLYNLILSYLFVSKKDIFEIKKFNYLKYVKNLDKCLRQFAKTHKVNDYFDIKPNVIIDKVPVIFIKKYFKNVKIIGYEFDNDYNIDLIKYKEELLMIKQVDCLYLSNYFSFNCIDSRYYYVVSNKKIRYLTKKIKNIDWLIKIVVLFGISLVITVFSFFFVNSYFDLNIFKSYFELRLFMLNLLPILILVLLIFLITKRVHISWLITSSLVFIWGIVNQTKVFYRDDVVKFEDLILAKEALIMADSVGVIIKSYTIFFGLLIICLYFVLRKKINKLEINKFVRWIDCGLLIFFMIISYKNIYTSEEIYNSVGNIGLVNKWIFTRQSQIRGLVYPFIYSLEDGILKEPDNYDKSEVERILGDYKYQNISNDKKVNIIAIMLEAYNDFSKFEEIKFNEDIYKYFHKIQEKSISGNLVVNSFGGSTVTTERNFLTGYYEFSNFRKKTDSYIWYFKEQGYRTEAMHPIYGAFYNRASINPNLGFDIYYNYENKYSKIQESFVKDDLFFESIIAGYEKSRDKGRPYFNFSVTYQNHVPYSDKSYEGKEYYFDNNYDLNESSYNLINEYFSGIKSTNEALKNLIDYFDNEDEPVIIVLFGDHNPALGDNASIYHEIGIDISLDSIEGFLNYYQTPYVIHANKVAKDIFKNKFVGNGDDISSIFLMNELFEQMGLKGNSYLQYMSDLKEKVDVIHRLYCKNNDEYIEINECKKFIDEYKNINYYMLKK